MKRRTMMSALPVVLAAGVGTRTVSAAGTEGMRSKTPHTFVLVHGAWHGGWCWSGVADVLRAAGHRVYTPTQTGLADRSHLMSGNISINTFVDDIANLLIWEQLQDVVLVGHSFGGISVTGVADRMPERLRRLVYLDALLLQGGQTAFSQIPPDVVAARIKAANESSGGMSLPVPPASAFGLTREADQQQIAARLTPHPLSTYNTPLNLKNVLSNGVPTSYINCTAPIYSALAKSRTLAKEQKGWTNIDLATGHDAMVAAPVETAQLFMKIAG